MQLICEKGVNIGVVSPKSGVYGWQFPDGKWIVGSSKRIRRRTRDYRHSLQRENSTGGYGGFNQKAKDALEKNSWTLYDLKAYVLEYVTDPTQLNLKENEWSVKLDSVANGYNTVPAGELTYETTEYRSGISSSMVLYHARKRKLGVKGYVSKFDKLWADFRLYNGELPPTDETRIQSNHPFAVEWNRSNKARRQHIRSRIGGQVL
jgi:hypothetical protein